jgi:hypothetical protein
MEEVDRLDGKFERLEKVKVKSEKALGVEIAQLKSEIDTREKYYMSRERKYMQESEAKQAELDGLRMLHVKSVDSVDAGLEPVFDKQLKEKFSGVRIEVWYTVLH